MPAEKFGKYSLLHKLATGGMGEVWLARQSGPAGFDRFIAVKRLLPNLAENNEFVQMFLDEARLAARLTHPNICQVYEFGREGGSYYLAMEYMHGESLSSMLERSIKERKPLTQPMVALIIQQALEGLHFAHEAKDEHGRPLNLVHRDISPSNIFVTYDGQVKLLDFGIAKAAHRITQTVAGSIKGKFGYIAPEVYKGMTIDRRVDLFAMGVVLWEMLTRRRLYKRAAEYEILRAIVEEEPPDPRSLDSSITPELAETALKALAKLPGERYQTALEMRRAVSVYLRSLRDEMDAQALAEIMVQLYGQVWIDLRSSVLESFKDTSGSVANADVLNHLAQRVAALETKPLPPAPDLEPIEQQLGALARTTADLSQNVAALQKAEQQQATDPKNTALALVLLQIRDAVDTERPFAAEYQALVVLARDHPEIATAAAPLAGPAQAGVASRAVLTQRLRELAPQIATAKPPPKPSLKSQIVAELRKLVTIRRIEGPEQTPAEAAVSTAEHDLASGNLAAAVAGLEALPAPNLAMAQPWLQMAKARLAVETALGETQAALTASLGGAASAQKAD